jgi:Icc-related predicted phosphoesterase
MRIIYIAGIHWAFDRVGQLLDATDADVYIIAADLIQSVNNAVKLAK